MIIIMSIKTFKNDVIYIGISKIKLSKDNFGMMIIIKIILVVMAIRIFRNDIIYINILKMKLSENIHGCDCL